MAFIGQKWEQDVPKDKQYLLKYFTTAIQRAFLKYYLVFRDHNTFTDHTGIHCAVGFRHELAQKVIALEAAHAEAKAAGDLENLLLSQIEAGKYRVPSND